MPSMVTLTPAELRLCTWAGEQRFAHARRVGRDPGQGPTRSAGDAANDIRGCKAEYAASLMLNLSWRPEIGVIKARDVGGLVDVRSTDRPEGRLIVKPADGDEVPFVLVFVNEPQFLFLGWLMAREAKRRPLLRQFGDPAHFVDQRDLGTFPEILELVEAWRAVARLAEEKVKA